MSITSRIIRIGNSRGVRIPATLLAEAELGDDVLISAEPGKVTVEGIRSPRAGWEEAARRMSSAEDDQLIDQAAPTAFESEEWEW